MAPRCHVPWHETTSHFKVSSNSLHPGRTTWTTLRSSHVGILQPIVVTLTQGRYHFAWICLDTIYQENSCTGCHDGGGIAELARLEFAGLENHGLEKQNLIQNQIPHLNLSWNQLFPTPLMRDNICNFVFIINIPTVKGCLTFINI